MNQHSSVNMPMVVYSGLGEADSDNANTQLLCSYINVHGKTGDWNKWPRKYGGIGGGVAGVWNFTSHKGGCNVTMGQHYATRGKRGRKMIRRSG